MIRFWIALELSQPIEATVKSAGLWTHCPNTHRILWDRYRRAGEISKSKKVYRQGRRKAPQESGGVRPN
jgi:hypothetical protein